MLETLLKYFEGSPLSLWGPFFLLLLCGLGLPIPEDIVLLAAGALMVAHDLRIPVPDELSIMGFAGTLLSEAATPQLSTVVAPAEELGAVALQTLLRTMDGHATAPRPLPMTLVPRASTAPPHRPSPR